jgi:hypothetical protein
MQNLLARLQALKLVIGLPETERRVSTAAAITMLAKMKQRIFRLGLDSNESKIGDYSTTPYYQNPNNLVGVPAGNVKPQGKNGLGIFKNGKPKKTRYLSQGYKELRELVGRQTNTVDLNFSGSLQVSMQVGIRDNTAVFGFTNLEEADKIEENESRFATTIAEPSQTELELSRKAAQEELIAIFESIQ